MLSRVKKLLRESPLTASLYEWAYGFKDRKIRKSNNRNLQQNGYRALKKLTNKLEAEKISYFCAYGTALGFYRDGGFIAHDEDSDIAILQDKFDINQIQKIASEIGATVERKFYYEGELAEVAFCLDGVQIDLFLCKDYPQGQGSLYFVELDGVKYPTDRHRSVILTVNPKVQATKSVTLKNGYKFKIPANAVEYLSAVYGPGWKTPDDKWEGTDVPTNIDLPGLGLCEYCS